MIGTKHGRLLVVLANGVGANGKKYWTCQCDCGNQKKVRGDHLRRGKIKSCGCWHDESSSLRKLKHGRCMTLEGRRIYDKERSRSKKVREFLEAYRRTERFKSWHRAYAKGDVHKHHQNNRRHRMRTALATGSVSRDEWKRAISRSMGLCRYCGLIMTEITMDHIVPISAGGKHCITNVAPACRSCNSGKSGRNAFDYLLSVGYLTL